MINKEDQIRISAGWQKNDDSAYRAFHDLMKKRKEIATAYLEEGDFEKQQKLKEMVLYLNLRIKAILGL